MWLLASFVCLWLGGVGCAPRAQDFDTVSGSYEFIYHQQQELLLTIHDKACYYSHIRGISCPEILEMQVMFQVRDREHVSHSSLESLRTKYQDLLANFHCLDKAVYEMGISSDFKCEGTSHGGDDDE